MHTYSLVILVLLLQRGALDAVGDIECQANTCSRNAVCHSTCPGGTWLDMKGFPVSNWLVIPIFTWHSNTYITSQVTQSSVAYKGYPEKAIDGNRNNNFEHGHSCSHTKRHTAEHASWTVTLPALKHIAVVKVTDRLEKQDRGRLNGFSIHVLDTESDTTTHCAVKVPIVNGETKAVVCNAVGNKIKITSREYLVLCT